MEYHSILKRNEILIPARIWMDLEDPLTEISHSQKDKYHITPVL